jgi:hypothetical protein
MLRSSSPRAVATLRTVGGVMGSLSVSAPPPVKACISTRRARGAFSCARVPVPARARDSVSLALGDLVPLMGRRPALPPFLV